MRENGYYIVKWHDGTKHIVKWEVERWWRTGDKEQYEDRADIEVLFGPFTADNLEDQIEQAYKEGRADGWLDGPDENEG